MKTKLTDLSDEKVLEELLHKFNAGGLVSVQMMKHLSQKYVTSIEQSEKVAPILASLCAAVDKQRKGQTG